MSVWISANIACLSVVGAFGAAIGPGPDVMRADTSLKIGWACAAEEALSPGAGDEEVDADGAAESVAGEGETEGVSVGVGDGVSVGTGDGVGVGAGEAVGTGLTDMTSSLGPGVA